MRALLLDIGNTRLKWGVANDGRLRRTGHVALADIRDRDDAFLAAQLPQDVDAVFASNVAGAEFAARLSGVLAVHCGCVPRFARAEAYGWGVTNGYARPERLGVDRWVAMVGAFVEVRSACLVVDAGTALTIDAIDDEGQHLGGQIMPGLATLAGALADATSDIPLVPANAGELDCGLAMFAAETADAVTAGVGNAVAGAVDRAIRTLQSNAYQPQVILTGGDASRILNALCETPLHRPDLVLQGLAHMLENTQ